MTFHANHPAEEIIQSNENQKNSLMTQRKFRTNSVRTLAVDTSA
jgi:hypothetical protein